MRNVLRKDLKLAVNTHTYTFKILWVVYRHIQILNYISFVLDYVRYNFKFSTLKLEHLIKDSQ